MEDFPERHLNKTTCGCHIVQLFHTHTRITSCVFSYLFLLDFCSSLFWLPIDFQEIGCRVLMSITILLLSCYLTCVCVCVLLLSVVPHFSLFLYSFFSAFHMVIIFSYLLLFWDPFFSLLSLKFAFFQLS